MLSSLTTSPPTATLQPCFGQISWLLCQGSISSNKLSSQSGLWASAHAMMGATTRAGARSNDSW